MRIATNGLNHLALPVADPERSARFYGDLFAMEILSISPETAFVRSRTGVDMIAFNRAPQTVSSSRGTFHFGFIVTPEQFDAAVQVIRESSVELVSQPSQRDIGRYIFIADPDGYVVEIFEDDSLENGLAA